VIGSQALQGFQKRRGWHKGCGDEEWSWPTEAEDRYGREIGEEVLNFPMARPPVLQSGRQKQRSEDECKHCQHAANAPAQSVSGGLTNQFDVAAFVSYFFDRTSQFEAARSPPLRDVYHSHLPVEKSPQCWYWKDQTMTRERQPRGDE
jgi:hypothetical protein